MTNPRVLLAGLGAFLLAACGGDDASDFSRQAAKTSAASPLEADFRLQDATPVDIDALFALIPPESRPTYESAAFDEALGATVVTNLRFSDEEDGQGVVVERAEFFGVDLDAIERVRTAESVGPDSPFETIFQKVRFHNVVSEGLEDDASELQLTIAGVEFDALKVRQGGFEGDGVGDEGARAFNAMDLAGLYFKDISFSTKSEEAPSASFAAPDLRFVNFGGGKLEAVIAKDLEYELWQTEQSIDAMRNAMGPQGAAFLDGPLRGFIAPDNQRTKITSFEWRGFDMSGLLTWALRDEEPPMSAENLIDLGTVAASDMQSYVGDKRAASIEEVTLSAGEFTWLIPSNIRADTKGAFYDLTAYAMEGEDETIAIMRQYGLDQLKGDGYAEWRWDSNRGDASLDYVANMQGFANFSLETALSGLRLNDMAAAREAGEEDFILRLGRFDSFSMKVADETALDVIFAVSALQMGGTGEDLRQSVPAMLRLSGLQAAQINARISDYIDALASFVSDGGVLTVSAEPAEPVGFSELQATGTSAPQTLPDVLDLTVTRTE